jgi:hypothetical protein
MSHYARDRYVVNHRKVEKPTSSAVASDCRQLATIYCCRIASLSVGRGSAMIRRSRACKIPTFKRLKYPVRAGRGLHGTCRSGLFDQCNAAPGDLSGPLTAIFTSFRPARSHLSDCPVSRCRRLLCAHVTAAVQLRALTPTKQTPLLSTRILPLVTGRTRA